MGGGELKKEKTIMGKGIEEQNNTMKEDLFINKDIKNKKQQPIFNFKKED